MPTNNTKLSFGWDTQPIPAIELEIRFLDQPLTNQVQETGPRKRSKQHSGAFAVRSIKCRQCTQQKKLRDEGSTNLRAAVKRLNDSRYTCAFMSSPPSGLRVNSSKTISMARSTSTRGSRVLQARMSEHWQKTLGNVCTLALTWRS